MPKKEKASPWKRSEDYAKQVSGEIIEQIKKGTAPWQKPWKPGEAQAPENFATGEAVRGREQPVFDEPSNLREPDGQPVGDLQPDPRSGRSCPQGRERNEGALFQGAGT